MTKPFQGKLFTMGIRDSKSIIIQLKEEGIQISDDFQISQIWKVGDLKIHPLNDDIKVYITNRALNPEESIEVIGQDFNHQLHLNYPNELFLNPKEISNRTLGLKWGLFLLGFFSFLYLIFSMLMPKLVDSAAKKIPFSFEQKIGQSLFNEISNKEKIDTLKSEFLNQFFKELDWDKNFPTKVYFIKSDIINAFALPGGRIMVYQGLFDKMQSYEELVALLGHEYGHIENRHIFRGIIQSFSSYAWIGFMFGDLNGIVAAILEQSNMIFNLKYSRAYESESDDFGLKKMKELEINPKGMIQLFTRLKDTSNHNSSSQIPSFLSTHPGIEERIKVIQEKINSEPSNIVDQPKLQMIFEQLKKTGN